MKYKSQSMESISPGPVLLCEESHQNQSVTQKLGSDWVIWVVQFYWPNLKRSQPTKYAEHLPSQWIYYPKLKLDLPTRILKNLSSKKVSVVLDLATTYIIFHIMIYGAPSCCCCCCFRPSFKCIVFLCELPHTSCMPQTNLIFRPCSAQKVA